jgi:hypothetical protein
LAGVTDSISANKSVAKRQARRTAANASIIERSGLCLFFGGFEGIENSCALVFEVSRPTIVHDRRIVLHPSAAHTMCIL